MKYIMALDQGTTSSRCILFDHNGNICSSVQKEFKQIYPQPGWVEHDANEIWDVTLEVSRAALDKLDATAEDVALMRRTVGRSMGVKAAGGIRSLDDALKMIAAGANRIGCSASVSIVESCRAAYSAS